MLARGHERAKPAAAKLKDGEAGACDAAAALARLPVGLVTRVSMLRVFVLPKLAWAAPLVQLPSRRFERLAWSTLTCTVKTKWWCRARYWADDIRAAPRRHTACVTLMRYSRWMQQGRGSRIASAAAAKAAEEVGCSIVREELGGWLRIAVPM